ncbi:MAG: hypothetical protein VSS75_027005 [Candidatus Parabeggiatoa sp.]|nr:hypothetical protein [Candidatus Parabeggiatoa sp.]
MFKLLRLCLILAACLFLAQGVRAEFTVKVVSSDSSQYKPGNTLNENDRITLKKDQNIILDHKGEKRSFTGLSKLVKALKKFFGVQRGDFSEVWQVDILRGEVFCYKPDEPVMLGRSKSDARQKTTLYLKQVNSTKKPEKLTLPARKTTRAWPLNRLPIMSGQEYEVEIKNRDGKKYFTFYQLLNNDEPPSIESLSWMEKKGCDRQIDLLTRP